MGSNQECEYKNYCSSDKTRDPDRLVPGIFRQLIELSNGQNGDQQKQGTKKVFSQKQGSYDNDQVNYA